MPTPAEPPHRQCVSIISGPIPGSGCYLFEPAEGGTRFTQRLEAEIGGFFKLAEPLVGRTIRRQMDAIITDEQLAQCASLQSPSVCSSVFTLQCAGGLRSEGSWVCSSP